MIDTKKEKWEDSYSRKENFIYYPKEEAVKFLNRFVKKRVGADGFIQLLEPEKQLKGLDFGCGIGRITLLMHEFGIDGYGVDISENAILEAKNLATHFGMEYKTGGGTSI